jgi:alpha-amylase
MNIQKIATSTITLITMLGLSACGKVEEPVTTPETQVTASADVFVQLFEWRWPDVAAECETFLGPAGFSAVQVSPAQEHVKGTEWWVRYQPVSYKIESRGGTREEFANMVERCANAGVKVYADALANHMASIGSGVGVAGSPYSEFSYTVPYEFDDFHHCDRNGSDNIANYQDLWEVQTCHLSSLADLDTGKPSVQEKIAAYLDDLLSLGVAGFRMDAAKHMPHEDIDGILQLVGGEPFVFQEVIDRGGEAIDASAYLENGKVTEFKYPMAMIGAFENGDLASLKGFDTQAGFLPADQAIVFVDNHDIQRGHAGAGETVNYKDGSRYNLAVAFMLAYPYGYPMVMSSYAFDDPDQGPPASSPSDAENGCGKAWICEHRRTAIANMVGFRKETAGTGIANWQLVGDTVLSFGRGNKGHVVINNGEQAIELSVPSSMPPGRYCDVISGGVSENGCTGLSVTVGDDGAIKLSLAPLSMIAIHHNAMITAHDDDPLTHLTDWQNSGVLGTLVYWQNVTSEFLSESRHVEVWLPPGYEDDPERRYKVIYMHDGQNLFDPRLSYTGIDWGVDEAMMRGVEAGLFEPAIVVGAWNSPQRAPEYSPWHGAPNYARFLIEELMPRVNAEFRTFSGREDTFVMGSSMGGLLSFYLVKEHPDKFSACGCVSTHFPISESVAAAYFSNASDESDTTPYILRDISNGDTVPKDVRFFFDYGTKGLDAEYGPSHAVVRDWLLRQQLTEGQDFLIREYEDADHNEASWRARLDDQLVWLLADE